MVGGCGRRKGAVGGGDACAISKDARPGPHGGRNSSICAAQENILEGLDALKVLAVVASLVSQQGLAILSINQSLSPPKRGPRVNFGDDITFDGRKQLSYDLKTVLRLILYF